MLADAPKRPFARKHFKMVIATVTTDFPYASSASVYVAAGHQP
jgi:hypothetical protein